MATGVRCGAVTKAGVRCRAWAMREGMLCVAHREGRAERSGSGTGLVAPEGLAVYEPLFSDGELAAIEAVYDQVSVKGEVAAARIVARRLLAQMGEAGGGQQLARFAPLVLEALRTVAMLMETEKGLGPRREDEIASAIGQALDELGEEWGVEL